MPLHPCISGVSHARKNRILEQITECYSLVIFMQKIKRAWIKVLESFKKDTKNYF